jgi:hypothetical protein
MAACIDLPKRENCQISDDGKVDAEAFVGQDHWVFKEPVDIFDLGLPLLVVKTKRSTNTRHAASSHDGPEPL